MRRRSPALLRALGALSASVIIVAACATNTAPTGAVIDGAPPSSAPHDGEDEAQEMKPSEATSSTAAPTPPEPVVTLATPPPRPPPAEPTPRRQYAPLAAPSKEPPRPDATAEADKTKVIADAKDTAKTDGTRRSEFAPLRGANNPYIHRPKADELAGKDIGPMQLANKRDAFGAEDPPPADPNAVAGGTFVHAGTNPFIAAAVEPTSTFAIDVDTGSFSLSRRYLRQGQLPPDAGVRVEEWVNAMHYSYAGPDARGDNAHPFAVHIDGAASPIARNRHIVRVALQGKKVSKSERQPTHLVFLVDVSGSMDTHDKLPLAKESLHLLADNLRDDDSVALVTYAGATGVVLPATMAKERGRIHAAIDKLGAGGGTNMGSGMELAYVEAAKHLGGGRSARVIVLSDGDANIGRTSHQAILQAVKGYVSEGVMMSTIGLGTGGYNDHLMEQLANAGNGVYSYVDGKPAARRVFVDELEGTLETIAQDVKIQVEWNPSVVAHYRLLGYENRHLENKDFRDDKKDAGEIGAGHAVTALYELELTSPSPREDLGVVRVRAKKPRGQKATEQSTAITASMLKERPTDLDHDAQTAAAVALAAEILRRSPYAEGRTLSEAAALLREAATGPHAQERLDLARDLMRVEPALARR